MNMPGEHSMDLLVLGIIAAFLLVPSGFVAIFGLMILRAIRKLREDLVDAGFVDGQQGGGK